MPRNSSGNYSLPAGNPVVGGTTITATWGNTTMQDVATALTDSLSRSGDGGMLASLELASGTISAPGLTWGTESTSGLYRAAAGDFRWAIGGLDILTITSSSISSSVTAVSTAYNAQATTPIFRLIETDAPANEQIWDMVGSTGNLSFRTRTDVDGVGVTWLGVTRTGTTVDDITLAASRVIISSTSPDFRLTETDGPTNEKNWYWLAQAGNLEVGVRDDAGGTATNWMSVTRTGTTVDTIALVSSALTWNGTAMVNLASTPTWTGAHIFSNSVTLNGAVTASSTQTETGVISPPQITADQNNYAPTGFATAVNIRLTSDTNGRHITGIAGGTPGRVVRLINASATGSGLTIMLDIESASSTAANRFAGFTVGTQISLNPGGGQMLWYDGTASRWILF